MSDEITVEVEVPSLPRREPRDIYLEEMRAARQTTSGLTCEDIGCPCVETEKAPVSSLERAEQALRLLWDETMDPVRCAQQGEKTHHVSAPCRELVLSVLGGAP